MHKKVYQKIFKTREEELIERERDKQKFGGKFQVSSRDWDKAAQIGFSTECTSFSIGRSRASASKSALLQPASASARHRSFRRRTGRWSRCGWRSGAVMQPVMVCLASLQLHFCCSRFCCRFCCCCCCGPRRCHRLARRRPPVAASTVGR